MGPWAHWLGCYPLARLVQGSPAAANFMMANYAPPPPPPPQTGSEIAAVVPGPPPPPGIPMTQVAENTSITKNDPTENETMEKGAKNHPAIENHTATENSKQFDVIKAMLHKVLNNQNVIQKRLDINEQKMPT